MSFLDRVTKAVGDAVDRGKKEVDQFMRIQRINSAIGESERKAAQWRADIQQVKAEIGDHVLTMLRAGTFTSAELQPLADRVSATEQQIAAEETAIAEKKAEIEKIKAEDDKAHVEPPPASASAEPSPPAETGVEPPMPPPLPDVELSPPPVPREQGKVTPSMPPDPAPARVCQQCGAVAPTGISFCTACGAKLAP